MMEIRAEHLTKSYEGRPVLRGVTFTAGAGITRIAGRSGAGKTTLLRILLGLETAESGTGTRPRWLPLGGGFSGGSPAHGNRAPGETSASPSAGHMTRRRAAALLATLGLGDVGDKRVRDYSGGMRRRLALARALLAPSDALVLDEPLTGLDTENRAAALRCILRTAEEKPVLLAAHETLDIPCRAVVEL